MTIKLLSPKKVIFCSLALTAPALALDIGSFNQQQNERFTDHASFVGTGLDLSGFGRDSSGRWATLISPNVFISADHFRPSGTISFYADNDINTTPVQRSVTSGAQIANSDLYVGYLDSPVTSDIAYYEFAQSIGNLSTNTIAYQAGIPDVDENISSNYPNSQNMVLGLNKLEALRDTDQFGKTSQTLWTAQDDSSDSAKYVNSEAQIQGGDSGAALFITDTSNNITLLGTAWYKGSFFSISGSRDASVYTFTAPHTDELNRAILTNAVPEPSSIAFSLSGLILLCFNRKR